MFATDRHVDPRVSQNAGNRRTGRDRKGRARAGNAHIEGLVACLYQRFGGFEQFAMDVGIRPAKPLSLVPHGVHEACRPAHINMGVRAGRPERCCRLEAGRSVMAAEIGASAHRLDCIAKPSAFGRPATIMKIEGLPLARQCSRHGHDRRDADAATDQHMSAASLGERKQVARRADAHLPPWVEGVMHSDRPAPRLWFAQHRDLVAVPLRGIVAERILPHQSIIHRHVDVCACAKGRQLTAISTREVDPHDVRG